MMVQTTSPEEAPTRRWPREGAGELAPSGSRTRRPLQLSATRWAAIVLAVGLLATGLLAWLTATVNGRNESRLLSLQVRQAGAVLSEAVTGIQTPLASAAEVAASSGGDPAKFQRFMASYVGPGRQFASASLWRLSAQGAQMVTAVGAPLVLEGGPPGVPAVLAAARRPVLAVTPILHSPAGSPRIGYAFGSSTSSSYVAYAEAALPSNRRVTVPKSSAFADLNFAIYIGRHPEPAGLVGATQIPLTGTMATTTVPFGDSALTLVGTPEHALGGDLSNDLPWIVGVAGVLLSLAAAALALRLVRRRVAAEQLAEENRRLYRRQRSIAETLQRSLLPEGLPEIPGIEVAVSYVPGASEVDVGGDWYDIIEVEGGFLFVVGDVSGRGLRAATKMAALHHGIRAYAAEGHPPAEILSKLGALGDLERDGHFATVLCGRVDLASGRVELVDAGHLAPLVLGPDGARYAPVHVGVPIGVAPPGGGSPVYRTTTLEMAPGSTLLAFTDGLVERRLEDLDAGLDRLRQVAEAGSKSLPDLVNGVVAELVGEDVADDTAVLGVQWLA